MGTKHATIFVAFAVACSIAEPWFKHNDPVPSKPRNMTVLDTSSDRISLTWNEPEKKNGDIEGYRVYYVDGNLTDVQSIQETGPIIHYNLTKLNPNTAYEIFVKAFTAEHEGNRSEVVYSKTDIQDTLGPGPPKILSLTCESSDMIYIKWARPLRYFRSIDFYNVFVKSCSSSENIMLPTSTEHLEILYSIKNVTTNTLYDVRIRASTKDPRTGKVVDGDMSDPRIVNFGPDCEQFVPIKHSSS